MKPKKRKRLKSTGVWSKEDYATWVAAKEAGDEKKAERYRQKIVADNYPLAVMIANRYKKFTSSTTEIEDLCQAGALGIMRALTKYDPSRAAFSTYAAFFVMHEIQNAIQRDKKVRTPRQKIPGVEYRDPEFLAVSKAANIPIEEPFFDQVDDLDNVYALLSTLSPEQFEILERAIYDEEKPLTIARDMSEPRQSVVDAMKDAGQKIRDRIPELFREPKTH